MYMSLNSQWVLSLATVLGDHLITQLKIIYPIDFQLNYNKLYFVSSSILILVKVAQTFHRIYDELSWF